MSLSRVLLCAFLLSLVSRSYADSLVPLIGWSNRDAFPSAKDQSTSTVESVVDEATFKGVDAVIVFSAPQVTFDDIARYGGVYGERSSPLGGLQSSVQNSQSSVWAGLEEPASSELAHAVASRLGVQVQKVKALDAASLSRGTKVFVITLNKASDQPGFEKQDSTILNAMAAVEKSGVSFVAFYTAQEQPENYPRQRRTTSGQGISVQRKIEPDGCYAHFAVPNGNKTNLPPYCMLFCATNVSVLYYQYNSSDLLSFCNLTFPEAPPTNVSCGNKTALLEDIPPDAKYNIFPYADIDLVPVRNNCNSSEILSDNKLSIRLYFPIAGKRPFNRTGNKLTYSNWRIDILLNPGPDDEDVDDDMVLTRAKESPNLYYPFAIPNGTSYSCSSRTYTNYSLQGKAVNSTYTGPVLNLLGIQVQPYGVNFVHKADSHPSFSANYDCEGYFSLSGWMGIFSMLLLFFIFYASIVCAFSIETVDRFDDPRGETISVENVH